MLVAVGIGDAGGLGRGAAGERPSRHAEAHGASPSPIARIRVRFKARNAHHAYSGRAPAQGSSFKRRARHSDRIFPNHQARCALLIPLRFEFANEFRPRRPSERPPAVASTEALIRPIAARRSAAFRPRGVTPNRGNNVAGLRRASSAEHVDRNAAGSNTIAKRAQELNRIATSPDTDIRNTHVDIGDCYKRQGGPNAQALEPPSF